MRIVHGVLAAALLLNGCTGGTPGNPPGGDGGGGGGGDGGGGGGDGGGGGGPDAAPISCTPVSGRPNLTREMMPGSYARPILLTSPPGDPRLFVVEQDGTVDIVGGGEFLNITSRVQCCEEEGLLGLAFHPQYASNRRFFVYYIDGGSNIQIDEYTTMSGDPNRFDEASRRSIISIPHTTSTQGNQGNHNGGMLAFGLDGYLYLGTGDGGYQNDPDENGQDNGQLLGKILRIDVDSSGAGNYGIPAGNPFGDEIWAFGLRNPWRFSFDRMTGDLWIGDVGQETWEEINFAASGDGGVNFGWDIYEGDDCFADGDGPTGPCDTAGKAFPVTTLGTGGANAIIGGYVYRGCTMPDYHGTYFFAAHTGQVRSFDWNGSSASNEVSHADLGLGRISAFGEGYDGELYLLDYDAGSLWKIVPGN